MIPLRGWFSRRFCLRCDRMVWGRHRHRGRSLDELEFLDNLHRELNRRGPVR